MLKHIDFKLQKSIEEVVDFGDALEKCYNFNIKNGVKLNYTLKKTNFIEKKESTRLRKKEVNLLINRIRELAKVTSNATFEFKKKSKNTYYYNTKIESRYSFIDTINPKVFPWFLVRVKGRKSEELFEYYLSIVKDDNDFNKKILKKSQKQIDKINRKIISRFKELEESPIFCICKRTKQDIFVGIFFRQSVQE